MQEKIQKVKTPPPGFTLKLMFGFLKSTYVLNSGIPIFSVLLFFFITIRMHAPQSEIEKKDDIHLLSSSYLPPTNFPAFFLHLLFLLSILKNFLDNWATKKKKNCYIVVPRFRAGGMDRLKGIIRTILNFSHIFLHLNFSFLDST
jgi:hypothetical protein